uniref:Uncharacterized protein n=1 Tax=Arundo donax TaxID=35708 RepID=A0A0A8Y6T3_ARUDO
MATEPHKLRFVRCPRCYQLLVEYPSIPVYKCGGCGTVLRAKNRAVPVAQAASESEEQTSFPSRLKGSPQNNKLADSGEQKIIEQPHEAAADGTISSSINNTNSCEGTIQERTMPVAESVTHADHHQEDTCSLVDGNIQNPEVTTKGIHDRDTSSSILIEKVENLDKSEDANGGNFGPSEVSTLYEKTEVVQREEKMHTYEDMHVESHEALIEELERSLSFSSDDEDFSDEVENSGLSDALRHQMGSRRFMLGGKMNDASRNDPHGRLIEELEMSFSDAEEPMEQHAAVADRVHRNEHDKHPQTLGAENSQPSEENISSSDYGHLKSAQNLNQENRLTDNANKGKEDIEDDNNSANYVHGNGHIVVADEDITERFHEEEHNKDWESLDTDSAHPCERSASSVDDGSVKQSFQPNDLTADCTQENKEGCMDDDNMTNYVHVTENLVFSDEDIAEIVHGNEGLTVGHTRENEESHMEDDNTANYVHGNENAAVADEQIVEGVDKNEHGKDLESLEAEHAHPCKGSISSVDGNTKFKQNFQPNDLAADGTQEKEEGCMEDDNVTNYVHGIEKLVFSDEDIAERVHGNEELALAADYTGKIEESHMEDDSTVKCIHGNENAAVADEHISEGVDKNEHGKNLKSLEAESAHQFEGVISSFNTRHIKSEQSFQQNELIADDTEEKEEGDKKDGDTTNFVLEDSASVASFSSLSNKRNQYKLPGFNKNKEEMPYRCRASQLRQGLSLDSEDFKSIRNFIKLQVGGTSSSLSSGSPSQGELVHKTSDKYSNIVRHERLKKMDELRDQLSRLSSQKSLEKRYQKRGLKYQQQSNNYDVEQHSQSIDADSIPNSCALESYYGHGRPPRYQTPNPFSPTHRYTHCNLGHAQTRIPHNYDTWEFSSYYQSSYAESTILDHESLMSSFKEQKRMVRKHILRPLSGASPFTICNSCFNLVQMPSDIYISKAKIGKMQCGKCSKVLALSFAAVDNADAKINVAVAQQPYNPDDSIVDKNEDIAAYYAECLTGNPVCKNEEYGASFTRSLSTQAGSSLAATQSGKKVSDSALHRLMGYDSASQLLHHSRVFEDGYDSFESMVPVSSRVSRRKNT